MPYDVVTIGGGFSGLITACRAAELGLRAAVLEQLPDERYLCSSRYTTGASNVMGLGILHPPDVLFDAILKGSGANARPELARAVADNGKRAIDWLKGKGAQFSGQALADKKPLQQVLGPTRAATAGLDWEGRAGDVMMQKLEQHLNAAGSAVHRGVTVASLVVEGGACTGVETVQNGKPVRIEAAAVVIADGGFAANPAMVAKYITPRSDRVFARVGPGAKGDGIRMAEAAGAAVGGFGEFYGHLHHRNAMTDVRQWPYPHLDAAAEVGILVGPDGWRFTDEGLGGVCMSNAVARLPDPLSPFLLIDDAIWRAEPQLTSTVAANPTMIEAGAELTSAGDLATLAARIGVPAAALEETVRAHNEAVARKDFSGLPVPRSVRKHPPMPISTPPFHAVPLCAGITGTMGGVQIDANAQATRTAGGVFPGLYAVGTPVAGLEGGPRAGYVGGLSKSFILALLAAEHIAQTKIGSGRN